MHSLTENGGFRLGSASGSSESNARRGKDDGREKSVTSDNFIKALACFSRDQKAA